MIAIRADSTLRSPIRSVVCTIWRWRLLRSTTSKSTRPIVPTPAAARYSAAGLPSPPAPMSRALRREELGLAGRADLRDQQVAAVALLLLGGQDDRGLEVEAGALPALEPAVHRLDVGVAHLGEGLGREQRADAAGAVQDHRRVAVRRRGLDLLLDVGLGDVLGAGDVALLPLGRLADVDDRGRARGEGGDLLGRDFTDLGAGLAEEVGVGLRHGVVGLRVVDGLARSWRPGRGGRMGEGWPGAAAGGQAGSLHLQRRSILVMPGLARAWRSLRPARLAAAPRSPSTCCRLSWLSIAHLRRAGLMSMPSRSSRSSARMAATSVERLALDLVGQEAGAGLADGAATAGEPDAIDDAVLDAEHQRDPVATQRVGALVRGVGVLDDPEVVGPPIVLEDVVAVEVVHARSSVARDGNPDHRGRD